MRESRVTCHVSTWGTPPPAGPDLAALWEILHPGDWDPGDQSTPAARRRTETRWTGPASVLWSGSSLSTPTITNNNYNNYNSNKLTITHNEYSMTKLYWRLFSLKSVSFDFWGRFTRTVVLRNVRLPWSTASTWSQCSQSCSGTEGQKPTGPFSHLTSHLSDSPGLCLVVLFIIICWELDSCGRRIVVIKERNVESIIVIFFFCEDIYRTVIQINLIVC